MISTPLYDHAAHPRHRQEDAHDAPYKGHAANPMCGDVLDVGVWCEEGNIVRAVFAGKGCAVCIGSASLLCSYIQGKTTQEAFAMIKENPCVHLQGERIGLMREGCAQVISIAFLRALSS